MRTDWQLKTAKEITEQDWLHWQQLVDQDHNGNLVYHRYFVAGLLQYFAADYYLAIYHSGATVQQMCFLQKRRAGIWQLVHPAQATSALIVGQVATDWQGLFHSLPGFAWRFDLHALDSQDHKLIIDCPQPKRLDTKSLDITINLQNNFAEYLQQRPKNLRKNLGRYLRRLEQDSQQVELKLIRQPADIHAAVCRYGALESAGWKGQQGTALDPNNSQTLFYSEVLCSLAQQEQVLIAELYADNQLLASRLCIYTAQRFVILKTTYDESQKHYAPGRLLLYKLLEYLFSAGLSKTIDFYTNTTADQMEWSTHARLFYNCSIYRHPLIGWLSRQVNKSPLPAQPAGTVRR